MLTQTEISAIIAKLRADLSRSVEGLEFEPSTHTYTYHGEVLPPVSDVCKIFEKGFDAEYWSRMKASQTGQSQEEVLKTWKANSQRACEEGTNVHAYAQWLYHKTTGEPIADDDVRQIDHAIAAGTLQRDYRMDCVDAIWQAINAGALLPYRLYPVAAENRIVNPELKYAGTFDLLCLGVSEDGTYGLVILDYKTNANLFNVFKPRTGMLDKMNHPLHEMPSCNAANYSCQLNLYQLGIERATDIPVIDRVLLWVEPNGVAAIAANDQQYYYKLHQSLERQGKKSKWKFLSYYIYDIAMLKHDYNFTRKGNFGLLHLPLLKHQIHAHIKSLPK